MTLSIKSVGGGKMNKPPTIRNFSTDGAITPNFFTIKYIAEDFENTILRHYIYKNGEKKEITKEVGYESINNEFSYFFNGLTFNTEYKIQVEVTDGVDTVRSDILTIRTPDNPIFGIKIIEGNSNPETCCTYIEDSVGVQVANSTSLGGWSDKFPYNSIRVVGFKDGQVTKEINKSNCKQYKDGTLVPSDVDVMIEIPKFYWKVTNIYGGYEIRISNAKNDSTYGCFAHRVNGIEKDCIYVGRYLGYVENGKLRSKSGVTPTNNINITQARQNAQAVGQGYQQLNWYTLTALQILYLIAYKNLNSQSALGMGLCGSNGIMGTGYTDTKGFVYGEKNTQYAQMCLFGIEDLWGNMWQWVDGIHCDASFNISVTKNNKDFNENGVNYENLGVISSSTESYGYVRNVCHSNKALFVPTSFDGGDNISYADYGCLKSNTATTFGGGYTLGTSCGIFTFYNYYSYYTSNPMVGARLCYLGT